MPESIILLPRRHSCAPLFSFFFLLSYLPPDIGLEFCRFVLPQMPSHLASVPLWCKPIFVQVKDSFCNKHFNLFLSA